MKQVITYILLIGIGILIGFFIFHSKETDVVKEVRTVYKDRVKTKTVRDTLVITKEVTDTIVATDSLTDLDSLFAINDNDSSIYTPTDEEVFDGDIITERLVSKREIELNIIKNDSLDESELLNINSKSFNSTMIVEFWESPIELTGYELTRNKLKLFGFNPNESFSLHFDNNKEELLVKTETIKLYLTKTQKFKSLNL
ncbi:MAG: hypothetical protein COA32_11900 [Fluviicola sp.]|nr:MAG: hypothetical protein COA32_11900 [Fluviicola sp.]